MDPNSRFIFASHECVSNLPAALNVKEISIGILFLLLRLCFFVTAVATDIAKTYVQSGILDTLAAVLFQIRMQKYFHCDWINEDAVVNEVLKLVFNVTLDRTRITSTLFNTKVTIEEVESGEETKKFEQLLSEILTICITKPIGKPAMGPPHLHAINCLVNFPFDSLTHVWLPDSEMAVPKILVKILAETVQIVAPETGEEDLDETIFGYPVDHCLLMTLILLKKIALNSSAKEYLKNEFMPHDIDRSKPLNKGTSFTAALVRVMTSVRLLQTRDFLCDLLVTLCDGNSMDL
jgi:hypothetical protein